MNFSSAILLAPQLDLSKTWSTVQRMVDAFMDSLPRLILAVIVVGIFYVLSMAARLGIDRLGRHRRRHNLSIVAGRLASATILLVGVLVGLTALTPSFRAGDLIKVLGIGSVAIGFAFQNILQNFLAGILLLWSEPFRIDDQISVDSYEGTVEEIQARATVIRTYDGRRVVIPNADLFTHSVTVNTAYNRRRWEYEFTIGNVDDIEGFIFRSDIADAGEALVVVGVSVQDGVRPDAALFTDRVDLLEHARTAGVFAAAGVAGMMHGDNERCAFEIVGRTAQRSVEIVEL